MQPDLPWNVAGIPSEAREAARAAARREGMSVGEWLTRRILRSFSGESENFEANAEAWRAASAQPVFRAAAEAASATTRDTEEMLANVARSESETQNAYRRIEDQMGAVARRLDAAERSQSENSRAMSKAATEINIATREQAQAFDQLGSHVVGLSERLRRVEQQGAQNDMREAVKALHQGLSRLAEQISSTANQSASQISMLAGNLETLAGKLAQTRNESENSSHNLDGRIVMLDSRLRGVEQNDGNSAALLKLSDMVDRLTARFSASEAQAAGNFARMEEHVEALDTRTQDPGADHRLQGIERALADIAIRMEHSEQSNAIAGLEDSLHALAARVDTAEKRQRESAAELQAALKENAGRAEAFPAARAEAFPAAPMAPPQMAAPAMQPAMAAPAFDLPPFPDAPPAERYAPSPAFEPAEQIAPPPFEPAFSAEQNSAAPPFAAEASQPETSESFLSAARRAARAAAATQAEPVAPASPLGTFSWGFARDDDAQPADAKKSGTRWVLIGGIALIAIVAAMAGILLNSGPRTVIQPAVPPLFPKQVQAVQPAAVKPVVTPPAQTASKPAATPKTVMTKAGPPQASTQQVAAPTQHVDVKPSAPVAAAPRQAAAPADKLTTLANGGNAMAQTLMGLKYLDGDGTAVNEAEAARWFDRAAKQGEPIAEYRLGTLYERGRGVPVDAKKATTYYAAAAKAGNRKAMHNLAVAYAQGSGVPKDLTQAAQWFSRAANLGLSDSQFNLAVLYERGMGVPQSLLDAYKWYAVAAAHGDTESKARIDALATQINPDDRAAAQRSADTFQPKPMDPAANTPPDVSAL